MKSSKIRWSIVPFAVLLFALVSCGSGSSGGEDDGVGGEAGIATLSGVIAYDGDNLDAEEVAGLEVVIGLIEEWPMTTGPKEFLSVEVPAGGFPFIYEVELSYLGSFFLAAFLDVVPTDGVSMNVEIDPMDVPEQDEEMAEVVEGQNQRDFVLSDPEDIDYWWQE